MGVFERLDQSEPEPLTAANPSGKNGYDSGMTFEESTKGVERDSGGKFAPENGSHQGRFRGNYSDPKGRAARRRASMDRSRKAREEKENKKSEAEKKKAEAAAKKAQREAEKKKRDAEREAEKRKREAEKRKRDAQQAVLSQISLQISEAILAGDKLKAAELRVDRAKKVLEFADTPVEKTNAQVTLNNALKALASARKSPSTSRSTSTSTSTATQEDSEAAARERAFTDLERRYARENQNRLQ